MNAVEQPYVIHLTGLDQADEEALSELEAAMASLENEGARCRLGASGTASIEIDLPR